MEVIKEPKLIGCLCCSPVPNTILPKDYSLFMGFGMAKLEIDNKVVWMEMESKFTVKELEKEFDLKDKGEIITLHLDRPLHDETYQYSNGEWYLIHQGNGFA